METRFERGDFGRLALTVGVLALAGALAWRARSAFAAPGSLHDAAAAVRPVAPGSALPPGEQALAQLFENAAPSVVSVTASHADARYPFGKPSGTQKFGTAFFWEGPYLVTNHHLTYDLEAKGPYSNFTVTLRNEPGMQYHAALVGSDPENDLAVLKLLANPGAALPKPIPLGRSRELRVGQNAYAIGNPLHEEHTLTAGIVSALRRRVPSLTGRVIQDVIQTDAAINFGNSGGPLLDSAGRLIGVVMAVQGQNLGYAIPVDILNGVVPELIRRGAVQRAGLGISLCEVRSGAGQGLAVTDVYANGPAHRAGLEPSEIVQKPEGIAALARDVILAVDNAPVRTWDELYTQLDRRKIGDRAVLRVERNGQERDVAVTLGDRRFDRRTTCLQRPNLGEDAP